MRASSVEYTCAAVVASVATLQIFLDERMKAQRDDVAAMCE
jgi:hypothetical protein